MPANSMVFTDPFWLTAFAVGGAAALGYWLLTGPFQSRRAIAAAAFTLVAANSLTSFVRFDDDAVSARKMFTPKKIAWGDVSSVEIVRRHGKSGPSDWLQIGARDGGTIDVEVDNLAPDRAAQLAAFVARRLPAETPGRDEMAQRLAPGRQLALRGAAPGR